MRFEWIVDFGLTQHRIGTIFCVAVGGKHEFPYKGGCLHVYTSAKSSTLTLIRVPHHRTLSTTDLLLSRQHAKQQPAELSVKVQRHPPNH
jgi:hypothetical protein